MDFLYEAMILKTCTIFRALGRENEVYDQVIAGDLHYEHSVMLTCTADFNSVVRGYHIYKAVWQPLIGERITFCIERGNAHAVSIQRDSTVVGHVPREVSKVFKGFLKHGGEVVCEI